MTVAVRGSSCFASSCKINHLGINPVSGGSPPRERRAKAVVAIRVGVFAHAKESVLILVADDILNERNAVVVIKIYVPSARRVSWGANCRTIIIQPICAMEE